MTIATALTEIASARATAWARTASEQEQARELECLEDVVEEVETLNIGREHEITDELRLALVDLCNRLPVEPPPRLWRVRTTLRLHEALLDWEDRLLDHLAPQRLHFDDRHD